MPKALPLVIRQLAQALYLQGISAPKVCEELQRQGHKSVSTVLVDRWATRYGWRDLRTQTKELLVRRTEPALTVQVANESLEVRQALSASLQTLATQLKAKPAKSLAASLSLQAKLEPAVRNASKVHAWDQNSTSTTMSVSAINTISPAQVPESSIKACLVDSTEQKQDG